MCELTSAVLTLCEGSLYHFISYIACEVPCMASGLASDWVRDPENDGFHCQSTVWEDLGSLT